MTPSEFITKAVSAAREAGHIFPEYAACEAALESAWGTSKLCRMANNLFGQKAGFSTQGFPTIDIPTREFLNGAWVVVPAKWPCFPAWGDSFRARMELLKRKSAYKPALEATDGESFVREVSKVWATDPERGNKVLSIYRKHIRGVA